MKDLFKRRVCPSHLDMETRKVHNVRSKEGDHDKFEDLWKDFPNFTKLRLNHVITLIIKFNS